jgi:hypothetical protein
MWDGRDVSGNKVSVGMYYYSIEGELSDAETGKIILSIE